MFFFAFIPVRGMLTYISLRDAKSNSSKGIPNSRDQDTSTDPLGKYHPALDHLIFLQGRPTFQFPQTFCIRDIQGGPKIGTFCTPYDFIKY